jgi:hypothetical protein
MLSLKRIEPTSLLAATLKDLSDLMENNYLVVVPDAKNKTITTCKLRVDSYGRIFLDASDGVSAYYMDYDKSGNYRIEVYLIEHSDG